MEIDASLKARVVTAAKAQNVHLWEVVENALREALPAGDHPEHQDSQLQLDVSQRDRKAS
ncbi:hypothetical protein ACWF9G_22985 [Nocardia sp. NPDC055029]